MRKKRQEFMDLKQGGRSIHNYSKLFNHLAQYTPDQVDTDEEKKDRFMIGLSTKLQGAWRSILEGCGSSIQKCSPKVPDGVPPRLHLPTSTTAAAPVPTSAAAVDSPPTSAPTTAGNT
jgi:hypothetical protein